jgi:competence protein ComEC
MKFAKVPRQPFVGLAMMAAVAIVLADNFPVPISLWFGAVLLFSLTGATAFCWPKLQLTYATVGAAFFLLHSFQIEDTPGLRLAGLLSDRPRSIGAVGFVTSEPKIGANGFATFLVKLESIQFEGESVPTSATMLVRWPGNPELGDELKFFGIAEPVSPPRNPGEFDMRSYLERRDVRRSLFVRYPEDGTLLRRGGGNRILNAAQKSRAWLQNALCRGLDDSPDVKSFLSGITLGLRRQTPEDIEEPFQQTGTLHLFAVAGLHVGIVARLLWILSMMAQLSRKWATALIIPLLLFYSAITGLHVSSVRAAVMASILLCGYFFERKVFALNSLAAAAFFLLCWDTNELFATGFQLSFAVVGGIVLLADPLSGSLQKLSAPDPFLPRSLLTRGRRIFNAIFAAICRGSSVSLAAWIGSLVLIFWYFNLVTPISLFANLVVVPIAFFILGIALLSILTAPLLASVSVIFNNANWFLARAVLLVVHWFAQFPTGHYYFEHFHWPGQTRATITVLDAGTGAAVHVRAHRAEWLFDCGSERDYERLLRPYLHVAGINRLEGILLSHGDAQHIGGAGLLFRDLMPRVLVDNPSPDRSVIHKRLRQMFSQCRIRPANLHAGETFNLSPGISAKILFPPPGFAARTADDDASVVQLAILPSTKILFTSDAGGETERALVDSKCDLRSDILVKGQHHSGQSGSDAFLNSVQPRLIIATSRDFPDSERVRDEWAEAIQARGIKLFRQDQTGAVEISFAQGEWKARAYVTGETFRSVNR